MAAQRQFEIHTQRYGDNGFRPFATIHCATCRAVASLNVAADFNKRLPHDVIQRKLERLGWSIGSNGADLCPNCRKVEPLQHEGTPMVDPDTSPKNVVAIQNAQAPAPNRKKHVGLSFPQRLKLFEFLKAVCKVTPEGFAHYDEGWNDARVAR